MQELPEIEVICFLEWLKHYGDIDEWDLFFKQEYYSRIYGLAEEYCWIYRRDANDIGYSPDQEFVKLFFAFRESDFYSDCINRHKQIQKENDYDYYINSFLWFFRRFCFKSNYRGKFGNDRIITSLNAQDLINNTQIYLRNSIQDSSNKSQYLQFMTMSEPIVVDFLEWVGRRFDHKSTYLKIDTMSVDQFNDLANEYCLENQKGTDAAKKLFKFFKDTDPKRIINKLRELLNLKNNKDIRYLIDRYCNEEKRFKCMILTLESKEVNGPYKKMIKDYYTSLDEMSGETLDIYYSDKYYGTSGYEIVKLLTYIDNSYKGKLPCIMLWKDRMEDAGFISIDNLNDNDIFQVISFIVKEIEEGKDLNNIVMEAEKMSKERNAKEINNTINNYGNMGNAVIGDNAKVRVDFTAYGGNQFLNELNTARKIISENEELNDAQKNELLDIIKTAKESVEENSEEKAEMSKARFKSIIAFMGDHGSKLITSLAGLATLLSFLGIKP